MTTVPPTVSIRRGEGKTLLCSVGRHLVLTDRKSEDGGADAGCTSGELLLVAAGSCATGSARFYLEARGLPARDLATEVSLEPSPTGRERDMIVITLSLPEEVSDEAVGAARRAVFGGGVVGRLMLGSEVDVRTRRAPHPA
jgi:uncharacterized OsmC-like protein